MSEEEAVSSEQLPVISENQEDVVHEKLVPVSEAIRYRKRAQAAEKELAELKEKHAEEVADLKAQIESVTTPSLLRSTPPLQGESLSSQSVKTQGVKETRTPGGRSLLQNAAKQAAGSGSRSDVQEYLRLRRAYV